MAPICSTVGRGTRLRVLAPASLHRSTEGEKAAPPEEGTVLPSQWAEGRMLAVLDDDEAARDALASALRAAGAYVVAEGSLEVLRELLDNEQRFPDALVFDLDLRAHRDGLQAVEFLRAQWQTEIPAPIVTGWSAANQPTTLPARCALLVKPVGLTQLVTALAPLVSEAADAGE